MSSQVAVAGGAWLIAEGCVDLADDAPQPDHLVREGLRIPDRIV